MVVKAKQIWNHRGDAGCGEAAPKTCPTQGRIECFEFTFNPNVFTRGVSWFSCVLITRSINTRLLLPALAQAF